MGTVLVKHLRFEIGKDTFKDLMSCDLVSLNTFDDELVVDFAFSDELKSFLRSKGVK